MTYQERTAHIRQLPGGCIVTLCDGNNDHQEFVRPMDEALELIGLWMRHEYKNFKELGVR